MALRLHFGNGVTKLGNTPIRMEISWKSSNANYLEWSKQQCLAYSD